MSKSNSAHWKATGVSTITSVLLGHPWDTASKRLQVHKGAINFSTIRSSFQQPFSGIGWAAMYKAMQWTGKLGLFRPVKQQLNGLYGESFRRQFGEKKGGFALAGVSGALIGMLEACVVLPMDSMKVLKQTNPNALSGNAITFFMSNYIKLYRGLSATIARNAPGSALLLGGQDIGRQIIQQQNHGKTSLSNTEAMTVSIGASLASIIGTYPIDLVKTTMQHQFGEKSGMLTVAKQIYANRGLMGFAQGMLPKIAGQGPKVTMSMFAYQKARDYFEEESMRPKQH